MKFDLISDIHIEHNRAWDDQPGYDGISSFYPWHIGKQSDVMVVAGDCSNDAYTTLAVIDEATKFYDRVVFVDGNHEHYSGYTDKAATVGANMSVFRRYAQETSGVTYLDGITSLNIDGTAFFGSNGWYDWTGHSWYSRERQHQFWKEESNDSRCIRFDPNGYPDKLARLHAEQLRLQVEAVQQDALVQNIVMITHTVPHRRGLWPDNQNGAHLNGSYFNAVMGQVWVADKAKKIKAWVYGHTHDSFDDCVSEVSWIRFVNNSRGYYQPKLKPSFAGVQMIDIENPPPRSAFEIM